MRVFFLLRTRNCSFFLFSTELTKVHKEFQTKLHKSSDLQTFGKDNIWRTDRCYGKIITGINRPEISVFVSGVLIQEFDLWRFNIKVLLSSQQWRIFICRHGKKSLAINSVAFNLRKLNLTSTWKDHWFENHSWSWARYWPEGFD